MLKMTEYSLQLIYNNEVCFLSAAYNIAYNEVAIDTFTLLLNNIYTECKPGTKIVRQ